jgi:flagellar motility protein MotE (MotC chaperone)
MPSFRNKENDENKVKLDKNGKPVIDGEDGEETLGSKIVIVFITLLIILVWLAIIAVLIKTDFGGFGSTVLRPLIKDVPYLNMILPENDEVLEDTQYQFETIDDAVDRIKELEALLDAQLADGTTDAETIASLQAQVSELQIYKQEQDAFEILKEKFYEEVVFSDQAPSIEEYKTYYEGIDPENAEVLYKQTIEQLAYDAEIDDYVKTYSTMKAKEAAAIFDTMTDDFDLVADILRNMSTKARADILGKMDPENAAKLTAILEPDN